MKLTEKLKNILYDCGADLVGIGDISKVENGDFNVGIAVAVALPERVIMDLRTAPTKEYYNLYYSLNRKLNDIVTAGENYLINMGYEAYAQTTDRVKIDQDRASEIPHKTVERMQCEVQEGPISREKGLCAYMFGKSKIKDVSYG